MTVEDAILAGCAFGALVSGVAVMVLPFTGWLP